MKICIHYAGLSPYTLAAHITDPQSCSLTRLRSQYSCVLSPNWCAFFQDFYNI